MKKKKLLEAILIELKQINSILNGNDSENPESLKSVKVAYKQRQQKSIEEISKFNDNFMQNALKAIEYLKETEPKINKPQVGELEALSIIEK